MSYRTCPDCGSNNDCGEICDCRKKEKKKENAPVPRERPQTESTNNSVTQPEK